MLLTKEQVEELKIAHKHLADWGYNIKISRHPGAMFILMAADFLKGVLGDNILEMEPVGWGQRIESDEMKVIDDNEYYAAQEAAADEEEEDDFGPDLF